MTNGQLQFIELPERYRGDSLSQSIAGPAVTLTATVGKKRFEWGGTIVRAEGSLDEQSRQLFVVAQIDDPYARKSPGTPPLKVGQFVRAAIQGKVLEGVFVIPRGALREGNHVLIVDEQRRLRRRRVDVIRNDATKTIVSAGLKPGELLCITALSFAVDGVRVDARVLNEKRAAPHDSERPAQPYATKSAFPQAPSKTNIEDE